MPQINNKNINVLKTDLFGRDPVSFLKKSWVAPSNYGVMHRHANWNTVSGALPDVKLRANMVPTPNASITNDDLYELQDFTDGTTTTDIAYCALDSESAATHAHDFDTVYALTQQHNAVPIYFLPSRGNQISCLALDATPTNNRPRLLLTTAVDGCSLFVTCDNVAQPLNQANHPRFYHANGAHANVGATATARRASALSYTRELLRSFVAHNGQHLALELTMDHYYASDLTDEQTRKLNLNYTVNSVQESRATILVMGVMDRLGVWSFYYQRHVVIDYTRSGWFKVKVKGSQFTGEKTRLCPLHVPQAADWGGAVP